MSIRWILADFDGTLADSMPYCAALPYEERKARGIAAPADLGDLIRARPMGEIAGILAARYAALGDREALYEAWTERMAENYAGRIALKPGAEALLEDFRRRELPVCLLTATDHRLLDPALDKLGLKRFLCAAVSEAEAGGSKRTGVPYRFCLERLGARAEETLLLEDSLPNLRGGRAAGLKTCGVYDESMAPVWEDIQRETDVSLRDLRSREALLALL